LLNDVCKLIDESKSYVAHTTNATLTLLYWNIGKRINEEILKNQRAEYGQQIMATVAAELVRQYGNSFSSSNLRRMLQFASSISDNSIVVTLSRQLSWSHFVVLITLKDDLQRTFYMEMCRLENWPVRTLRDKIDSMLYERTAVSKKPEELIKEELQNLREKDTLTPDLVFRDPYILNFLGLKDTYSEKDLEAAILQELEKFILELGKGFAFVERQKRMIIDGEDFKLDLLFFHRRLKRLVAVDLKIGKFKAGYKSQMELYLRWLEKYEMQEGEASPVGLLLCTEGSGEQIELLQLDKAGIRVAEYLTELPEKKLLQEKLQQALTFSKNRIDSHA
jgi:predicted nuclease of restriction endonuclease-like (RecB) superfamily